MSSVFKRLALLLYNDLCTICTLIYRHEIEGSKWSLKGMCSEICGRQWRFCLHHELKNKYNFFSAFVCFRLPSNHRSFYTNFYVLNLVYMGIIISPIFKRFRKIGKSDYHLHHVCLSVLPHGATRLPLCRFLWNLTFDYFSKTCREITSLIKIWQEERVLYMKTDVCLWKYVAEFFLKWIIFQTRSVEQKHTVYTS
jgi:hypothetical protein